MFLVEIRPRVGVVTSVQVGLRCDPALRYLPLGGPRLIKVAQLADLKLLT